jgi:lipopolysaccharide/colanic/teichoic acid biosynthesis glycosyltransferase
MLILGRKYKFKPFELEILDKKFDNITFVSADMERYKDKPEKVLEEFESIIKGSNFKLLVLNTNMRVNNYIIQYLTKLQFKEKKKRIKIITIEQFVEEYLNKCYIPEDLNDLNYLTNIFPYSKFQYFLKRIIDYIGVAFLWLAHLYFKPKVKKVMEKESPGSLYFTQTRVGKYGKKFTCYKFRTMHEHGEDGKLYTEEHDNRIFPYGEFMRKTRIDEIPQYKNIIRGEMHLIGPRAEWDRLVEKYEKDIPYYNERHLVAPGITGWAQVNYPYGRNVEDARQKLMYDLYYIKHWSLWLELEIIWKTAVVMFKKKGL